MSRRNSIAEQRRAGLSDSSALALQKKYTRLQSVPLTLKFKTIEITKETQNDFALILNLISDPTNEGFKAAWKDTVDAVCCYRLTLVDNMAKPGLIVRALKELRNSVLVVKNALPSLMIVRAELECFAERLGCYIAQIESVKGTNRRTAPADLAKMLLRQVFAKHQQRISKDELQEKWEKFLAFVVVIAGIPHPDPNDAKAPSRWKAFAGKFLLPIAGTF